MKIVQVEQAEAALDRIGPQLAAAGAEGELAYGLLGRIAQEPDAYGQQVTMLIGIEAGQPIAFVIRTGVHPALIVGFIDEHAIDYVAFVRELQRIDHVPTSVNGAERCSIPFADAWTREAGFTTRTRMELRAFELHELCPPATVEGHARAAVAADAVLLEPWCEAFARDIGDQLESDEAARVVTRFVASEDMLLWVTEDGPVSMAAINRRTPSSSCVAWVYTPPEHRRHGYASAVVAALSKRELDAGASWCSLFTDRANPTSNHIYTELGYEPRCDFRHIELVPQ